MGDQMIARGDPSLLCAPARHRCQGTRRFRSDGRPLVKSGRRGPHRGQTFEGPLSPNIGSVSSARHDFGPFGATSAVCTSSADPEVARFRSPVAHSRTPGTASRRTLGVNTRSLRRANGVARLLFRDSPVRTALYAANTTDRQLPDESRLHADKSSVLLRKTCAANGQTSSQAIVTIWTSWILIEKFAGVRSMLRMIKESSHLQIIPLEGYDKRRDSVL